MRVTSWLLSALVEPAAVFFLRQTKLLVYKDECPGRGGGPGGAADSGLDPRPHPGGGQSRATTDSRGVSTGASRGRSTAPLG